MINLALTMLPILVTFAVAAWNSPTDQIQPRSALSTGQPHPCDLTTTAFVISPLFPTPWPLRCFIINSNEHAHRSRL